MNLRKYLDEVFSINKLTFDLSNQLSEFYFAILGGRKIGYLKVNFGQAQTELKDEKSVEIERIYVLKEFHGMKVGQILYNTALFVARQKDADCLWLGVWEKNLRAIQFYKKNGLLNLANMFLNWVITNRLTLW